jgi:nucleoside-diphosphate-sugar epimerase
MAGNRVFVTGGTGHIGRPLIRRFPVTRGSAERLGLVTLDALTTALVGAVGAVPMRDTRILEVSEIRRGRVV